MHARWPIALLALASVCACARVDPRQAFEREPAPEFLFTPRPFTTECDPPPRGSGPYATAVISPPPAPYIVRRNDVLTFSRAQMPALTIVADPGSAIEIQGTDTEEWSMRACAKGGGQSEPQAADMLQRVAVQRTAGVVNVTTPGFYAGGIAEASLVVDAPRDGPVIVNGTYAGIEVHDMSGPLSVASTHARVSVLGSAGQVNAASDVVDFASDRGRVLLSATLEMNVKMTATHFDGTLDGYALRAIKVLLPGGFASSIEAVVPDRDRFVCRADICSDFKETRQGTLRIYRYAGKPPPAHAGANGPVVRLRSEESNVVIDTIGRTSGR